MLGSGVRVRVSGAGPYSWVKTKCVYEGRISNTELALRRDFGSDFARF